MVRYLVLLGLLVALISTACNGSAGTQPQPLKLKGDAVVKPVALNFGIPKEAVTGSVVVTDDSNTLVISKILMTLEDIDFERSEGSIDCGQATGVDDHLDCSDYLPGPVLLNLDLTGRAPTLLDFRTPIGATIEVISYDISVPDGGDPHQLEYLEHVAATTKGMEDISIRIEGNYNEKPFTFDLDLRGDQEIELDPPLRVTEDSDDLTITILFDPRGWFLDENEELIDPNAVCPVRTSCETRDWIEDQIERVIQSYSNS